MPEQRRIGRRSSVASSRKSAAPSCVGRPDGIGKRLRNLWHLRAGVVASLAVAALVSAWSVQRISLFPPSLTPRSLEMATASTHVVVDTPTSSILDLRQDTYSLEGLTNRAVLLGEHHGLDPGAAGDRGARRTSRRAAGDRGAADAAQPARARRGRPREAHERHPALHRPVPAHAAGQPDGADARHLRRDAGPRQRRRGWPTRRSRSCAATSASSPRRARSPTASRSSCASSGTRAARSSTRASAGRSRSSRSSSPSRWSCATTIFFARVRDGWRKAVRDEREARAAEGPAEGLAAPGR